MSQIHTTVNSQFINRIKVFNIKIIQNFIGSSLSTEKLYRGYRSTMIKIVIQPWLKVKKNQTKSFINDNLLKLRLCIA
jgi:hypothetical protein